ncbi:MAG TPA: FAD-dependent oxidoreductase [Segeticoccus sp.]|nr:FAD-dependent oxidoreductase [Segeticoccus sp.]
MAGEALTHAGMVVVGGGECGTRAAMTLRELGWTGAVTVVGDDPLHAYERPPLSKAAMVAEDDEGAAPVHPYTREEIAAAGVAVHTGTTVRELDTGARRITCDDGTRLGYERLLLTVGSAPRSIPAVADAGALTLRTHADAERLRARLRPGTHVGIVGAGFIGLELAAAARHHGCAVTVLEAAPRALARAVPAAVADRVVALHRDHGVDVRFGAGVTAARRDGAGAVLELDAGGEVAVDTLVLGIGVEPRVGLAREAGLALDNGIRVDDRLRTSAPDVYAAGDCCSFPHPLFGGRRVRLESWRSALDQAVTAARNLLGEDVAHEAVPWFWSDQYDHVLQVVGLSQLVTRDVVRERPDGVSLHFGLDEDDRLVCGAGFGQGGSVAKDVRLAQRLIERGISPEAGQLADPSVSLRDLVRSVSPGVGR